MNNFIGTSVLIGYAIICLFVAFGLRSFISFVKSYLLKLKENKAKMKDAYILLKKDVFNKFPGFLKIDNWEIAGNYYLRYKPTGEVFGVYDDFEDCYNYEFPSKFLQLTEDEQYIIFEMLKKKYRVLKKKELILNIDDYKV